MTVPVIDEHDVTVHLGDVREQLALLEPGSVQCCVTSPPYFGLRDYGVDGQIGLEASPAEYVAEMVAVFREVRRVLADDGVLWLNLGDSYANPSPGGAQGSGGQRATRAFTAAASGGCTALPAKNLMGIPWRVAFALQDDDGSDLVEPLPTLPPGLRDTYSTRMHERRDVYPEHMAYFRVAKPSRWTLRNAVIWSKPNAMPESVTDRLSTRYEHVFLFSKSRRYTFDLDPIRARPAEYVGKTWAERKASGEATRQGLDGPKATGTTVLAPNAQGSNPGDVWTIATSPFPGAHFATMPPEIARRCILTGCPEGGTVLDPFTGSGTTAMVARSLGRKFVGVELNPDYIPIIRDRIGQQPFDFGASA